MAAWFLLAILSGPNAWGRVAGVAVSSTATLEVSVGGAADGTGPYLGPVNLLILWFGEFTPISLLLGAERDKQLPLLNGHLLCLALSIAGRNRLNVRVGSSNGLQPACGSPLVQAASLGRAMLLRPQISSMSAVLPPWPSRP